MKNLDEEMKKLKKRELDNPLPIDKMAKLTAGGLDKSATQYAYKIFRDKKFRKLARFEKLEQIEQDRIFNELVIAVVTLVMLLLEARDLRVEEEMKDYYLTVRDEMIHAHLDQLEEYGIEPVHRKQWKKLLKMRYKEYSKDKLKAREAAMQVESTHKKGDLEVEDLESINMLIPLQTVAIGTHHHICRSKTKGKDELFKRLLKLLGKFYVEIRVPMEGGKITKTKRLLVKARKFFTKR